MHKYTLPSALFGPHLQLLAHLPSHLLTCLPTTAGPRPGCLSGSVGTLAVRSGAAAATEKGESGTTVARVWSHTNSPLRVMLQPGVQQLACTCVRWCALLRALARVGVLLLMHTASVSALRSWFMLPLDCTVAD